MNENSDIAPFTDAAGRQTANALHWARDRKITEPLTGGDKIDPTAPTTRAELARFIRRYKLQNLLFTDFSYVS